MKKSPSLLLLTNCLSANTSVFVTQPIKQLFTVNPTHCHLAVNAGSVIKTRLKDAVHDLD